MKNNIERFYYFDNEYKMRKFIENKKREIGYEYYNNCYKHMEVDEKKIGFVEMLRCIKI